MTTQCDDTLRLLGPVSEVLMRIEVHADGWSCWLRHRHIAGLFQDCPPAEYSKLTADELMDVLGAELSGLFAYRL